MELSDLNFLFRFLPIFLLAYYFCPARHRNRLLFVSSLLFYLFNGWVNTLLLTCSLLWNYWVVLMMSGRPQATGWRRGWLGAAVLYNLGTLCYFKYASPNVYYIQKEK